MQAIEIREPELADESPLEALITDHFSAGSSYAVELGLDDPTLHVRVAEDATGVVGVMAVNRFKGPDAVADEMYFFDDADQIPDAEHYGLLEMGYVRPDATGRGIGSRLLECVEEIGQDQGVDLLLADSWFHGGDDSPRHLFDRFDYETVHTSPIERSATDCPKCTTRCVCEGALVVKRTR